jgi:hypothetical protein
MFDPYIDLTYLTFPYYKFWNVTEAQLQAIGVAPYVCQYNISVSVSNSSSFQLPSNSSDRILSSSFNQRHLLQSNSEVVDNIMSLSVRVVQNVLTDFDIFCNRIRDTASISGAPVFFSYPGVVFYARNFYTRTGVFMETPQISFQGTTCSSVAVQVRTKVPLHSSLIYHRSSICLKISSADITPSASTVSGSSSASKNRLVSF